MAVKVERTSSPITKVTLGSSLIPDSTHWALTVRRTARKSGTERFSIEALFGDARCGAMTVNSDDLLEFIKALQEFHGQTA